MVGSDQPCTFSHTFKHKHVGDNRPTCTLSAFKHVGDNRQVSYNRLFRGYNRCGYYRITFSFLRTIFLSWTLPLRLLPPVDFAIAATTTLGLCHCGYYHITSSFENNFGVGIQKGGSSFRILDLQRSHTHLLRVISLSYF